MSSNDQTDALVPPGAARVPTRPGVTLISVPAAPPQTATQPSASGSAPSSSGPAQSGGAPAQAGASAATHNVQPQPATTNAADVVIAPPGAGRVAPGPGIALIRPVAVPPPTVTTVPQVTGPGVQSGPIGGSRTNAAAPNDGIISAILRAERDTPLSGPSFQPVSTGIGGNPASNRVGAPISPDNRISQGNINFAIVGQPSSVGGVNVRVSVDIDPGSFTNFSVQVGANALNTFSSKVGAPITVPVIPGQKITVYAFETSGHVELELTPPPEEPTVAIPAEAEGQGSVGFKVKPDTVVTSAQAKVVDKNGIVLLTRP